MALLISIAKKSLSKKQLVRVDDTYDRNKPVRPSNVPAHMFIFHTTDPPVQPMRFDLIRGNLMQSILPLAYRPDVEVSVKPQYIQLRWYVQILFHVPEHDLTSTSRDISTCSWSDVGRLVIDRDQQGSLAGAKRKKATMLCLPILLYISSGTASCECKPPILFL